MPADNPRREPALDIILRDLRERGANRGEPCGVHERPQWTCAFCLYNLLEALGVAAEAARLTQGAEQLATIRELLIQGPESMLRDFYIRDHDRDDAFECCYCDQRAMKLADVPHTTTCKVGKLEAALRPNGAEEPEAGGRSLPLAPSKEVKVGVCYKHKHVEWKGCYTICGYCHASLQYVTVEEAERISGRKRPEWWKPESVIGHRPQDAQRSD